MCFERFHPLVLASILLLCACTQPSSVTGTANIRLQLGLYYLASQDYFSAERNLRKAQQADPTDYRPLLAMARLSQQQRYDDQAQFWYTQALRKVPENGYVLNNYGDFLCGLRQYDRAHELFRQALASTQPAARRESGYYAGLCYLSAGLIILAEKHFQELELVFPGLAENVLNQAENWLTKQQWGKAALLLKYYHQRFPPTAESLWSMIYVAARQKAASDVEYYGRLLARNFPHSIQHQRYIANEY